MSFLRVVTLGAERVGKSDLLYRSHIRQEDYITEIEILDTCSRGHDSNPLEAHIQWADGFVVVYDICDRLSFSKTRTILEFLHQKKTPFLVPCLLLANKHDLSHRRQVGVDEGHELALEFCCQFYEVSAAETYIPINIAFQALLRDAKITQTQRSNILRRRRSSLLTVSKKLVAIFGKKEQDMDRKRPSCDVPNFALSI